MTHEGPARNNPEKKQTIDDNARKFIVEKLDVAQLAGDGAVVVFCLITDWLVTDENTETKVVRKEFPDGTVQMLRIEKVTIDGKRTAHKEPIAQDVYAELLGTSVVRVQKTRYEFALRQGDDVFDAKYDEFADSSLRILEVDTASEETRALFDPASFQIKATEVTGNRGYEGYRVADKL